MLKRIGLALALALLVAACGSRAATRARRPRAAAASLVGDAPRRRRWLGVDADRLQRHHDRAAGDELVEHQLGGEFQLEQLQLERQSHPHPAAQPDTALRRQAEDRRR